MGNLGVIELYDEANKENTQKFIDSSESTLKVQVDKKIITKRKKF